MSLHPLAERFGSVADRYERGRPEYPPAAVGAMMAELRLRPGARVLDLAAGTGKLTRALLAAELDVVAVEPQSDLRDLLSASIGAERVREGLAEAIPLQDASVDAVTVADGFHWFQAESALEEIRRVLRPRGGLSILSTVPDWSGATWAQELGTLVAGTRPEHPYFDGPPWQDSVRASAGWMNPREVRVTSTVSADPERVVDHMASISWMAALEPHRRDEAIARMRAIVQAGETPPELRVHFLVGLTGLE